MENDTLSCLCALSKVFAYKCAAGRRLIELFGGPEAVFGATRENLKAALVYDEFVAQILDPTLLAWARTEVAWAEDNGIELMPYTSTRYPRRLAECDDAPLILYYKGSVDLNPQRALAVVGTRKATWYGRESCRKIVSCLADLSERPMIVSGLALGIDGCAHGAALEAGLPTVGVLPNGLDDIYPRQHRELAARIVAQGALVTDFPRQTAPVAHTFIRRNRLIAGMADATLLAESFAKGGGLITVSLADSYGREVFAVPGRLTDSSFEGCNAVIRSQVAQIVTDADCLPLAMGWTTRRTARGKTGTNSEDSPVKRAVLRFLGERGSLTADELARLSGYDASSISVALFELEVEGRAAAEFGNRYARI